MSNPEEVTVDPVDQNSSQQDGGTSLVVDKLSLFYGQSQALSDIDLSIQKEKVTAFIGPSGCGKSTLLRCFNRMNDLIDDVTIDGQIIFDDLDIHDERVDVGKPTEGDQPSTLFQTSAG